MTFLTPGSRAQPRPLPRFLANSPADHDFLCFDVASGRWKNVTVTVATSRLNAMVGDSGSGGLKGLVPAPAAGDAAAGKFLKADGTFAVPAGGAGSSTLAGDTDVTITSAADKDFLIYESSSAKWKNKSHATATADLDALVGDSGSGGTKGLVPAPSAGDAASAKFLKADATWSTVPAPSTLASISDVSASTPANHDLLAWDTSGGNAWKNKTLSALLDAVFSSTRGTVLYRGASAWSALAAGTLGYFLQTNGSSLDPAWAPVIGGAGGGSPGLYAGQMSSTIPTSSNTGLTTWLNQGVASVSDNADGILLAAAENPGDGHWHLRTMASPTPPYTITGLFVLTPPATGNVCQMCFGWTDNTQLQVLRMYVNSLSVYTVEVKGFSTTTSNAGSAYSGNSGVVGFPVIWWRIRDDNAGNVYWSMSFDGVDFTQMYHVAKGSGLLGSGGYSNVCFGVASNSSSADKTTNAKMKSWVQGT